jgi:transposase-like protein
MRNKEPAYQFLKPSSRRDKASFHPNALNTDKNSLYGNAITRFKREGQISARYRTSVSVICQQ